MIDSLFRQMLLNQLPFVVRNAYTYPEDTVPQSDQTLLNQLPFVRRYATESDQTLVGKTIDGKTKALNFAASRLLERNKQSNLRKKDSLFKSMIGTFGRGQSLLGKTNNDQQTL